MILEHAVLDVSPEEASDYERALAQALPLIRVTPGFIGLEVRPCVGRIGRYLLLVRWQKRENHVIGFRQSDRYAQWSALLHRFYRTFPEIDYFEDPMLRAEGSGDA